MARLFEAALAWELAAGRRAQPADEAEVRDAVGRWAKRQPQRRPKLPVRHQGRHMKALRPIYRSRRPLSPQ